MRFENLNTLTIYRRVLQNRGIRHYGLMRFYDKETDILTWQEEWGQEPTQEEISTALQFFKDSILKQIPALRYKKETSGKVVSLNGQDYKFHTDSDSVAKFTAVMLAAAANPDMVLKWKTMDGFVELNVPALQTVFTNIYGFINYLYQQEEIITNNIKAAANVDEFKQAVLSLSIYEV